MVQSDFPSAAKGISVLATMLTSAIKRISGNMILRPMPGHKKPTSGELREIVQSAFPSAAKGISELAITLRRLQRFLGI